MLENAKIVSTVTHVERSRTALTPTTTVRFANGEVATIPPSAHANVIADVLEELTRSGDPAYVETGPNKVISRVLIPLVGNVINVVTLPSGDLRVDLDESAALHVIRRNDPNHNAFAALVKRAEKAETPVVLTEDPDTHEIIDMRVAENPKQPAALLTSPAHKEAAVSPGAITSTRALELFSLVGNTTCDPFTAHAPCIPFLYPDDGCWGRASQMCKLILATGAPVAKLWYYGNLVVHTDNTPAGVLNWIFHVAPLVTVDDGDGPEPYVLDPSLFPNPVSQAQWESVLGDPKGTPLVTDPSIFLIYLSGWHRFDPDYSKTAKVLATYRRKLRLRAAQIGAPPYPQGKNTAAHS